MAKSRKKTGVMSVSPPYDVAASFGGYRTVVLTQALRVCSAIMNDAAFRVAPMFSPEEWGLIAQAYDERAIEPTLPKPGQNLAAIVQRAYTHYRIGDQGGKTKKAMDSLVERLSNLSYEETWAMLFACQCRWDFQKHIGPEDPWWELAFRRQMILKLRDAEESRKREE